MTDEDDTTAVGPQGLTRSLTEEPDNDESDMDETDDTNEAAKIDVDSGEKIDKGDSI